MKNVSKKRNSAPAITSYAFYRPSCTIKRTPHGEAPNDTVIIEGVYEASIGAVAIYGESFLLAGKTKPEPSLRLMMVYQGRNYTLYFNEHLSDVAIRARAAKFVRQVELMALNEVKRCEYGAPVPSPKATAPATAAERAQLPLFDAGSITRAEHFDEVQQILETMLSKAKAGSPMVAPLSYALAANDALRVQYGIDPKPATVTAAKG